MECLLAKLKGVRYLNKIDVIEIRLESTLKILQRNLLCLLVFQRVFVEWIARDIQIPTGAAGFVQHLVVLVVNNQQVHVHLYGLIALQNRRVKNWKSRRPVWGRIHKAS